MLEIQTLEHLVELKFESVINSSILLVNNHFYDNIVIVQITLVIFDIILSPKLTNE